MIPSRAPRVHDRNILQEWAAKPRARGAQTSETRRRYDRIMESLIRKRGSLNRALMLSRKRAESQCGWPLSRDSQADKCPGLSR